MGVVYEAFDRERRTPVALKTLRSVEARALARFKNEFRALQDLEHPNLVSLGELMLDGGAWFFTMELVEGVGFLPHIRPAAFLARTADERAPRSSAETEIMERAVAPRSELGDAFEERVPERSTQKPFDEPKLRGGLRQLAQGIAALHQAGKVHRDIKPSNILVTTTGRVVLVDFGLVTHMDPDRQSSSGSVVGTTEYMAPPSRRWPRTWVPRPIGTGWGSSSTRR